jgi:hypothetical protein
MLSASHDVSKANRQGDQLNTSERVILLERSLHRAAEHIGDITGPVMTRYYQRHPEAIAAFDAHALGNRGALEGDMVERVLYCLMLWLESPGEIEMLLTGSVIHHNDTLQIPPTWFDELVRATADIIVETIPPENSAEIAVWEDLRNDLHTLIEQSSRQVHVPTNSQ